MSFMRLSKLTLGTAAMMVLIVGCSEEKPVVPASVSHQEAEKQSKLDSDGKANEEIEMSQGAEILAKVDHAYEVLQSYEATIDLRSAAYFPGTIHRDNREFIIHYRKPGHLRFEVDDSNHEQILIVTDSESVQVRDIFTREGEERLFKTISDALMAHSGTSLHASIYLPSILLSIDWDGKNDLRLKGNILESLAHTAKLGDDEVIEEHECYRVECASANQTVTILVDKETFLIRRIESLTTPEKMKALHRQGRGGLSGRMLRDEVIMTIRTQSLNKPLDDSLFEIVELKSPNSD